MKKQIKGIIFDMDGTLLLSMHVWDTIGSSYLKRQGIDPDPDTDEIVKVSTLEAAAEYFYKRYGLSVTPEEITEAINRELKEQYYEILEPKEGVMSFLEGFRRAGMKMCIATATDRYLVEPALKRCGIYDYMEGVFTCTEVGRSKEYPDIYRKAAAFLGLEKDEVAVFEDAVYAAKTAKKDGFFLVGVYDDSMKTKQDYLKSIADLYLPDYTGVDVVNALLS